MGTTGLLVLSSVLLLVVGGALFAFDGWPGDSNGDEPETVLVQAAPTQSEAGGGPQAIAEAAGPAAEVVAGAVPAPAAQTPAAGGPGGGTGPSPDGGDDTPTVTPPGAPTVPTETPPGTDPDPPGGGGLPLPGGGELLTPGNITLLDGLGDGLESTTTFLGQGVVSPVSPDLGNLVTQTGQGLTDIVRALDGTPPPPRR